MAAAEDTDLDALRYNAMEQARELVERFHSDLLAPSVRRQRGGAYEQKVQEYYSKCYVERVVAIGRQIKKLGKARSVGTGVGAGTRIGVSSDAGIKAGTGGGAADGTSGADMPAKPGTGTRTGVGAGTHTGVGAGVGTDSGTSGADLRELFRQAMASLSYRDQARVKQEVKKKRSHK